MVQGYYTLEEAARILGMESEELVQMAQKRQVRAFADRGTWRFRTQDIEELARQRGAASSPELQLGESGATRQMPTMGKSGGKQAEESGVFPFSLEGNPEDSRETVSFNPPSAKSSGKSSKRLDKGMSGLPASDSDVRLVPQTSDLEFKLAPDSKVRVGDSPAPGPRSSKKLKEGSGESGVKLVRSDSSSDSDVKIVPDSDDIIPIATQKPKSKGSDSDIRIEPAAGPASGVGLKKSSPEDSVLTEEIDLDAELKKAEEDVGHTRKIPKPKPAAAPTTSPFELSDSDLEAPRLSNPSSKKATDSSSDFELTAAGSTGTDSSSDFELTLQDDSPSPIELTSDDSTDMGGHDDAIQLGKKPQGKKGKRGADPDSGINLGQPADQGIPLEQGLESGDSIEFELSLDSSETTPKPVRAPMVDSDSEFELTLDDSGGLAPMEEDESATMTQAPAGEEGDIFETDFEVPAIEDESGSQAVALDSDTNTESSDFDLSLGEDEMVSDDDSGSQVVVLDEEEEVDDAAATVARPSKSARAKAAATVEDDEVVEEEAAVDEIIEEEEEGVVAPRRVAAAAPPTDWGVQPILALIPCTIAMFLVGVMGFELLRGMWGYRQGSKVGGPVVRFFSEMFVEGLPKD